MIIVQDISTAKISIWEAVESGEALRLGNVTIAALSWHVDYDGLITSPPLGHYRRDWLVDVCGGDYPYFSPSAANIVRDALSDYDDELIYYFTVDPIDRDKSLIQKIQKCINDKAADYIISKS